MLDRLSSAAAEKARSDKIFVIGAKAAIPLLFVTIFLGTTMESPGRRSKFPIKIFLKQSKRFHVDTTTFYLSKIFLFVELWAVQREFVKIPRVSFVVLLYI